MGGIFGLFADNDIFSAIEAIDKNRVEIILRRSPNIIKKKDKNGMTPLHWATRLEGTEIAKLLISKGADVNAKDNMKMGLTPLHITAYKGNTDIAKLLIDKGADVNAKDNGGMTPLYWAVFKDNTKDNRDMMKLLISNGADINAKIILAGHPAEVLLREDIRK
ncbi:MAG: ankyrin repeat domain-containing protein [Candidatus Eremiobacteraeota bacterium]|nr:ankyrin repeat domain-containing protein [Candidatus Eremiobacteraeota bacterium]